MSRLTLALDTATEECAIALGMVEAGSIHLIAERNFDAPRESLSQLLPTVSEMLESLGVEMRELDAVVVGRGPGSFTGVRIGVSSAKGIAHALGIPLYGVGTLDAIAPRFAEREGILGIVGDAMRGEVYPALFRCSNGVCERLTSDSVARPEDAAQAWADMDVTPSILAGNGLRKYEQLFADALRERAVVAPAGLWTPTGRGLLVAHAADLLAGREGDGDAGGVLPVYTRLSDAEENELLKSQVSQAAGPPGGRPVPGSGVAGPGGEAS